MFTHTFSVVILHNYLDHLDQLVSILLVLGLVFSSTSAKLLVLVLVLVTSCNCFSFSFSLPKVKGLNY